MNKLRIVTMSAIVFYENCEYRQGEVNERLAAAAFAHGQLLGCNSDSECRLVLGIAAGR